MAQKLEAKIVSLVYMHCHSHSFASASCYSAAALYSVVHEIAKALSCIMEVFSCFTFAIDFMHQTTMKTKGLQLQRACKTRWVSNEATVRTRSAILSIWAALKQLSENNNDAMCIVLLRLIKQKISTWRFLFVNIGTSPDKTEQSYSSRMFDFAQVKASVELCINKLSDAAAKFELKANCEKFDSELEDLGTLDGLADSRVSSCMAFW